MSRLSHTKTIHTMVINDLEYEFIYSKLACGGKEIIINKSRELSAEEKAYNKLQTDISPELLDILKSQVIQQKSEIIQKISNTRCLHRIIYDNKIYEIIYIKTAKGERNIEIKSVTTCMQE